jgi:hypothetical protein
MLIEAFKFAWRLRRDYSLLQTIFYLYLWMISWFKFLKTPFLLRYLHISDSNFNYSSTSLSLHYSCCCDVAESFSRTYVLLDRECYYWQCYILIYWWIVSLITNIDFNHKKLLFELSTPLRFLVLCVCYIAISLMTNISNNTWFVLRRKHTLNIIDYQSSTSARIF